MKPEAKALLRRDCARHETTLQFHKRRKGDYVPERAQFTREQLEGLIEQAIIRYEQGGMKS